MGPRKLAAGRVPNAEKTSGWSREGQRRAIARIRKEEDREILRDTSPLQRRIK